MVVTHPWVCTTIDQLEEKKKKNNSNNNNNTNAPVHFPIKKH